MNAPTELLRVDGVGVRLGGVAVVDDVSLGVDRGQIVGLIGPNGAGKTTLVDAVTGFVAHQRGQVRFGGTVLDGFPPHRRARLGLTRTFQSLALFAGLTVREHLEAAASADRSVGAALRDLLGPDGHREGRIDDWLDRLGLVAVAGRRPDELGTGQRRRLALGRALVTRPALVVLDEPAPGLDDDELAELATTLRALRDTGTAVLLSDHHRSFVLDLCEVVHVLADGRIIASGSPAQVRADPSVVAVYLGADASARASPVRAGVVIALHGVSAGRGPVPSLRDLDLEVRSGELVALVGPSGTGRTTALLTIAGVVSPRSGTLELFGVAATPGSRRRTEGVVRRRVQRGVSLVPEDRALFPRALTVAEHLELGASAGSGRPRRRRLTRAAVDDALTRFPELAPLRDRRAGVLSGGEQQMLALARALAGAPGVLLVDELSAGLAPLVAARLLTTLREVADDSGAAVVVVDRSSPQLLDQVDRCVELTRRRHAPSTGAAT